MLTHPAVMACKRPVQDLVWEVKGASIRNPPVPAAVRSMLFVCKGNICRSPFAAARAQRRVPTGDFICSSAGLDPSQAARPPREACEAAASYGIGLEAHQPRPLTEDAVRTHDMTIVMEAAQLRAVRELYPSLSDRVFLLSLFDSTVPRGYGHYNIADPYGASVDTFVSCYRRIERTLDGLFATITVDVGHQE